MSITTDTQSREFNVLPLMKAEATNRGASSPSRFALALLLLCTVLFAMTANAQTPPAVSLRNVIGGFSLPVEIANAGDGTGRLFVVEQRGKIRIVEGAHSATPTIRATAFLDVSSVVSQTGSERGLLGLAFHPQYTKLGLFYIFYTRATDGALVVARVSRDANNPNVADAASLQDVIVIPYPSNATNYGGKLAFDNTGNLMIGTGDGGGSDDPDRNAQDRGKLLGKLLRISVGSAPGYTIPPSNPYAGNTCANGRCPEVWHYGLRNPRKFSFDQLSADIYIGDGGQNNVEEIHAPDIPYSETRNFGWPIFEGNNCYLNNYPGSPGSCSLTPDYSPPVATYNHDATGGSNVTAGFVYRGKKSAALQGYFIYGDFVSRRLFAAKYANTNSTPPRLWSSSVLKEPDPSIASISSFGEDEAGELYLLDYGNGRLVAIDAPGPRSKRTLGDLGGRFRYYYGADVVYETPDGEVRATFDLASRISNNIAPYGGASLLPGGFGWTVSHMGDLNGDGTTDLVWRHTDGSTVAWLMHGGYGALNARTLLPANTGWSILKLADLNGDGRDDIIWRHTDGTITTWLMDGLSIAGTGALLGPGTAWTITHTADLNGDDKSDLIWRNEADGTTAVWLMNGATVTSGTVLLGANNSWRVSHVADLNGDGKSDLLWRNTTDGSTTAWLMNGATVTSGAVLLGANNTWQVTHVGDLNGDGKADLLWRATDGAVAGWLMNGTTVTDGRVILDAGSGYRLMQLRDVTGDGKADLVWLSESGPTTGTIALWGMNGLNWGTFSEYISGPGHNVLPLNEPTAGK
jgi:glucose/arabinose dehydrogenase